MRSSSSASTERVPKCIDDTERKKMPTLFYLQCHTFITTRKKKKKEQSSAISMVEWTGHIAQKRQKKKALLVCCPPIRPIESQVESSGLATPYLSPLVFQYSLYCSFLPAKHSRKQSLQLSPRGLSLAPTSADYISALTAQSG